MSNPYINEMAMDIANRAKANDIGLEGFSTLTGYLFNFNNALKSNITEKLSAISLLQFRVRNSKKLEKLLAKETFKGLADVLVYQPVGFKDNMLAFSSYLVDLLQRLSDVDKRLIMPLNDYLAKCISIQEYADLIWIDKNIKLLDIDSEIEIMRSFFDPKVQRSDVVDTVAFKEVYGSIKDIVRTADYVEDGEKVVKSIDLNKILKAEETLVATVDKFIEIAKEHPQVITNNKNNIKLLNNVVTGIAKELELLSVAMFKFKALSVAHSDTVEKLESNLG